MTQIEKISAIVGFIVVGAGIFSHYISLQGDVGILKIEQQKIKTSIDNNKNIIMGIKSNNGIINTKAEYNKNSIEYLQNKIDNNQEIVDSLSKQTIQYLIQISQKNK